MKKVITVIHLCLLSISYIHSQSVGIGTINPEAKLDIVSTDDGLLIPRVALSNTASQFPLTAPNESELIYNTSTMFDVTPGYYYWDGSKWVRLAIINDIASLSDHDWYTEVSSVAPNNISNNIYTQGKVGIQDNLPIANLSVVGNIRSSFSPAEIDFIEIENDGSNSIINRTGANSLNFQHNGNNYIRFSHSNAGAGSINGIIDIYRNETTSSHTINGNGSSIINADGQAFDFTIESDNEPFMFFVDGTTDRIGIGTNNPNSGKLHVDGFVGHTASPFSFYADGSSNYLSGTCCGGSTVNVSIYATNRMVADEFNAFSDARIKNVVGISDRKKDLNTLMNIKITDYTMIDFSLGNDISKKVIAQELEEVYPEAVSFIKKEIPNLFSLAEMNNGWIHIQNDLKAGEKVKLIFKDRTETLDILDANPEAFLVSAQDSGKVFVYGKEVNDFRMVDYDALATLNISATQEQQKLINELNYKIILLENENKNLEEAFISVSNKMDSIISILKQYGVNLEGIAKK